ncbi:MAG: segregation/condensation protein A [Alphaproteobacteria bacterium]|nr:segregation/condensation protein A [Alphaproteobacteria bacterium]
MNEDWTGGMEPRPGVAETDDIMYVDVDGYEGPLDLLLDMARRQKVDLAAISILALAEQYLAFIETIRRRRIEVAADYLVMAAWLAYLKSRLMVPQVDVDEEPSGESLAAALQFRLLRLEAIRAAAGALMARPRLGVAVFARGMPEPLDIVTQSAWDVGLYELLKAYAVQRERTFPRDYSPYRRTVLSLQDARDRLQALIGDSAEWVTLDACLAEYLTAPDARASVLASSFSASLELVRQGEVEMRQTAIFAPLYVRRRVYAQTQAAE